MKVMFLVPVFGAEAKSHHGGYHPIVVVTKPKLSSCSDRLRNRYGQC
jgi:hypothetical protein